MIRPVKPTELAALADVAANSFADAFGDGFDAETLQDILANTRSKNYFEEALDHDDVLVETGSGGILGYVQFGDADPGEVPAGPGDQHLRRLYVATDSHGQGIGRRLLEAALAHPRLAEAPHIYLTVWEKNVRALRLYESVGFRRSGTVPIDLGGGKTDEELVMRKSNI
ncbi:MAG TPA: N-acetyltransferase [Candidatus Saccharimonadia bacterium]|jgi:ribosomal protein S18 acetylase RimI-like enzyme|nr:N-acetyltransferase [Candidatus Saccharimonadia bacterium]